MIRLSRVSRFACVLMLITLAGASWFVFGAEMTQQTQANVMIELSFTAEKPHDDPFNDVTLDVVFTQPDGKTLRVPGFWGGGKTWKVRYASPVVGSHTFKTEASDSSDAGLNGVTGAIEISPYIGDNPLYRHGPIRVASDERHLEYADGTPFLWLGDTWWMGLCHRLHWPDEFKTLTADRKAKGFNVIQIVAGLYPDMFPFDPRGANEAGFPWEKDYARINPKYFDAADHRLMHLVDQGFTPCIVGAWGYFMPWMGEAKLKQHWRYLIARYGAMPVVWCAAGEANLPWYQVKGFPYDDREQVTHWTHVMRYIRETDPFHRPLTIHPTGIGRLSSRHATDDANLLDFDLLQTPHANREGVPATINTVRDSYKDKPQMPVIDGEASYENLLGTIKTESTRRMFWSCMTNGACGHTYGANGIWQCNRKGEPHGPSPTAGSPPTGYGATPWDEAMNYPGSAQMGYGRKFFEQFEWWKFQPHPQWAAYANARADADPIFGPQSTGVAGEVRVIYVPDPQAIELRDLPKSTDLSASWFDPTTGQTTALPSIHSDEKGHASCDSPKGINHDWVLVLREAREPKAAVQFDGSQFLSWDTEGGSRAKMNLLRKDLSGPSITTEVEGESLKITCAARQTDSKLTFPFNPLVCATTVIPATWDQTGEFHLPAVISAPDFGQMRLEASKGDITGQLTGDRGGHIVDLTLDLPKHDEPITLTFTPVRLPTPKGINAEMWRKARRGWWNAIQPSAQWGDQSRKFSAPAGVLANNVLSDAVSCLMHTWADQIFLMPKFDARIDPNALVRRTIDWWIDHRMKPTGEMYAYWDHADMLDANSSPLIASWDYVEATGDRAWLGHRIEKLEMLADYLLKRDLDHDGLIESTHSGNSGTLIEPMRAGSAYDTINAGNKDAYSNILAYRALRCMADLEAQLNRAGKHHEYAQQADRLKAIFATTFFNPKTGWLAWWISQDGQMHDLSAPMITSLAICYGLVDPQSGRPMMDKLWSKIESVGFKRFDLGVPFTLAPVPRGDYLIGLEGAGVPKKEDGSDTFGQYLNGGCVVNDAIHFITALYIVGEQDRGDRVLSAMLDRQDKGVFPNGGGFQNGVVNEWPKGAEFYEWDGKTSGYEGHLTYSFTFLQAIFLRDPAYRAKLFRPLQ